MRIVGSLLVLSFAGCGAQYRQAHVEHVRSDQNAARIQKEAVACLRDQKCPDDRKAKYLDLLDSQADAVLVVP